MILSSGSDNVLLSCYLLLGIVLAKQMVREVSSSPPPRNSKFPPPEPPSRTAKDVAYLLLFTVFYGPLLVFRAWKLASTLIECLRLQLRYELDIRRIARKRLSPSAEEKILDRFQRSYEYSVAKVLGE